MRNQDLKIKEKAEAHKIRLISHLKSRMEDFKMSRYKLSKLAVISESSLSRFFNLESEISLLNFLKICSVLNLNPYVIASEYETIELFEPSTKNNKGLAAKIIGTKLNK